MGAVKEGVEQPQRGASEPSQVFSQFAGQGLVVGPITTETLVKSIEQLEISLGHVENLCSMPSLREPSLAALRLYRSLAKVFSSILTYYVTAVETGVASLSPAYREHLNDLLDRAEELSDTLAWGAEAHEELGELVRQETCAS